MLARCPAGALQRQGVALQSKSRVPAQDTGAQRGSGLLKFSFLMENFMNSLRNTIALHPWQQPPSETHIGFWRRAIDTLRGWHELVRSRRELAQMDERQLLDIGITRADAAFESAKPFWRR